MLKKGYKFEYNVCDAYGYGARWEGDILSVTFFNDYREGKRGPNVIEMRFHGVTWLRTTDIDTYRPADYDPEYDLMYTFNPKRPISSYVLIDRDTFNDKYESFMVGNDMVYCISCPEDNVVFIENILIFACNEIEVVRAEYDPNVWDRAYKFYDDFNKKYNRNPDCD